MDDEETQALLRNDDHGGSEPDTNSALAKSVSPGHIHVVVDFDSAIDPSNPLTWSKTYKWAVVVLLAFMSFTVAFTCISVVPIASRIVRDLDPARSGTDDSASVLLVTIWELGEAAGPLLIAPLSELFGRYAVTNVANVLFIAASVLAALCHDTSLFVAARALTGLAVASTVLNPAIVADMFAAEDRGKAMSAIMLAPIVGGATGPAISGAITQAVGWRRVLWMSAILAIAGEVAFLLYFRETYTPTILQRRAARLRKEIARDPAAQVIVRTVYETGEQRNIWTSITRPAVVLYSSGVLQVLSLFGATAFTFFYVMSVTLPDILEHVYHLSPAQAGSVFLVFSLGSTLAVVLCNLTLDRIYIRLRDRQPHDQESRTPAIQGQPEHRLPLSIAGGFLLPVFVALYGLIAQLQLPLPWLLLVLVGFGFSFLLAYLPLNVYIADAFGGVTMRDGQSAPGPNYAASAMTSLIISRCVLSTFGPLGVKPLVAAMGGWGPGFAVLGALALAFSPVPVLLMWRGARWRQRCVYTRT